MQRLKKAFLFILGLMVVPRFLSAVIMQALNREELDLLSGFFAIIYLIAYFSFPFLYRGKVKEKIQISICFTGLSICYLWFYLY